MDIYKKYKQNETLQSNGIDFVIGNSRFTVRRYDVSVPEVRAAYEKHIKPYAKRIRAGAVDIAEAEKIEREMFVKTAVITWANVTDEEGNLIEFSHDNAIELFTKLPELYKDLKTYATERENFSEDYSPEHAGEF